VKRFLLRLSAGFLCAGLLGAGVALAQDLFGGFRQRPRFEAAGNTDYDGRVVFVRVRYATSFGGFGRRGGGREPAWAHDYPTADIHLMKILKELTSLSPRIDGSNILSLDDPELMNHPVAYMSEPGFWSLSDEEAEGLRAYLRKGGFIIFDDFRGYDWHNLEEQMRRAMPDLHWIQLDASHPVFHSFFEIDSLEILTSYSGYMPTYYGMFEDNDPAKRLIAIANRDNDLGEYWEFSDTGIDPVDLSNAAYKFGVNYFIYGLTH
jgi:hypothetical protein